MLGYAPDTTPMSRIYSDASYCKGQHPVAISSSHQVRHKHAGDTHETTSDVRPRHAPDDMAVHLVVMTPVMLHCTEDTHEGVVTCTGRGESDIGGNKQLE